MTYHVRLSEDGRSILLPAEVAGELGLRPGADLAIELQGRILKITAEQQVGEALARLREVFKGYSVDQFLAERRADWGE